MPCFTSTWQYNAPSYNTSNLYFYTSITLHWRLLNKNTDKIAQHTKCKPSTSLVIYLIIVPSHSWTCFYLVLFTPLSVHSRELALCQWPKRHEYDGGLIPAETRWYVYLSRWLQWWFIQIIPVTMGLFIMLGLHNLYKKRLWRKLYISSGRKGCGTLRKIHF